MECDPRAPILVGGGQCTQRLDDPREGDEPLELIARAAALAAEDCGAPPILAEADSIRVPRGLWRAANPAAWLRERFGCPEAETALGAISGSMVQRMLNHAAVGIREGRRDIVVLAGGEAERSKRQARARGVDLGWVDASGGPPPDIHFGADLPLVDERAVALGLQQPAAAFSLFENAMRHARGETLDAHRERISDLWARFAKVAADNPHAWTREPPTAERIRTPGPDNRLTAWPYTKRMCSNMVVDQAAAVILCSVAAARRLGVPRDRWVFLHAATDLQRTPILSARGDYTSAPYIGRVGRRALDLAGTEAREIAHVDLYSCFPAAVQLAAAELGLSVERPLTVTGGLGFAGGPFNSYVLHATATLQRRLREDPGSLGLVSSIGGWVAKHAMGIYGSEPPERGFQYADLDDEAPAFPTRDEAGSEPGRARVETYALLYEGGEPSEATVACLCDDGRRAWGRIDSPSVLAAMTREELCGRPVALGDGGRIEVS